MAFQSAEFSLEDEDGITVVTFHSPRLADEDQLDLIKSDLDKLVEAGVSHLVLDFRHVTYISSAFLGVLIVLRKKMSDHRQFRTRRGRNWQVFDEAISGGDCDPLVLCGLDDSVREVFTICTAKP